MTSVTTGSNPPLSPGDGAVFSECMSPYWLYWVLTGGDQCSYWALTGFSVLVKLFSAASNWFWFWTAGPAVVTVFNWF